MTRQLPLVVALTAVLFTYTLAWNFAQIALPFYVQSLSPSDSLAAVRWAGWVLGIAPFLTILVTPIWTSLAHRSPRAVYALIHTLQGACFTAAGLARTVPQLFLSRVFWGLAGPAAALPLLIIGRSDSPRLRSDVSLLQSAITAGQFLGPLLGAFAAARLVLLC